MRALESAAADVAAGRPWKARGRLSGALRDRPADQRVIAALADVHRQMGDLPAAGLHRFLTPEGPRPDETEALLARFGSQQALFTALPVRAPLSDYPPPVQARLAAVTSELGERWRWRTKLERLGEDPHDDDFPPATATGVLASALILVCLLLFTLGGVTAVWLLARLLRLLLP